MDTKASVAGHHAAVTCRFAIPTLFFPRPVWFEAWDTPWTCTYRDDPHPIKTTDGCAACRNWEPKPAEP